MLRQKKKKKSLIYDDREIFEESYLKDSRPNWSWRISIDPGVHTGLCVWQGSIPFKLFLVSVPKGKPYKGIAMRAWDLCDRLSFLYEDLASRARIECIAIESITGFSAKIDRKGIFNKHLMVTHATFRGAIMAHAFNWGDIVVDVGKGSITKADAETMARSFALAGSEHSIDALQVGVCAGFDCAKGELNVASMITQKNLDVVHVKDLSMRE